MLSSSSARKKLESARLLFYETVNIVSSYTYKIIINSTKCKFYKPYNLLSKFNAKNLLVHHWGY
ncbi:hypothetical protein HanIR_Chr01g0015061 [Helianthus annuus]|nr:hypothetical protein HanIR_Chr01g0015061 [Helianthus annuus]